MRYQIPLMLKQGSGAIVNTSSGAGVKGFAGQAAYAAAKHGVVGLTKAAALDYASQNIRINAVRLGIIRTPMMDRFTGGTAEGRERVIAQEPIGRMGTNRGGWRGSRLAVFGSGRLRRRTRDGHRRRPNGLIRFLGDPPVSRAIALRVAIPKELLGWSTWATRGPGRDCATV